MRNKYVFGRARSADPTGFFSGREIRRTRKGKGKEKKEKEKVGEGKEGLRSVPNLRLCTDWL